MAQRMTAIAPVISNRLIIADFGKTGQRFHLVADTRFSKSRTIGLRLVIALLSLFFGDRFGVLSLGQSLYLAIFAHAVAFELDAMGIVYDAVEDRVGDGGFADHLVPA